jgi:hypothetical protein
LTRAVAASALVQPWASVISDIARIVDNQPSLDRGILVSPVLAV